MMTAPTRWDEVVQLLWPHDRGTKLQLPKRRLPHPLAAGMKRSVGMPEGQVADYRYRFEDGSGLHVKDFDTHYEAHLDEVHPEVNPVEHLRQDAPAAFVGGAAALGAVAGGVFGKSWKSAVAGAAIAGLVGALLTAAAEND